MFASTMTLNCDLLSPRFVFICPIMRHCYKFAENLYSTSEGSPVNRATTFGQLGNKLFALIYCCKLFLNYTQIGN